MNWQKLLNKCRLRPTTSRDNHRSEFERDFDRAVYSTPLRRLQDKAQVFPLEPHDAVRTRLTHSLEVSSVARGLAARNIQWMLQKGKICPGMDRSIEAIAATCGLIHDLGNPPFGHAGEEAIRAWFQRPERRQQLRELLTNEQQVQDFMKFEGNAQSLRLVTKLQILADYNGLNLTFGTLSALCKYLASSDRAKKDAPDNALQKPGYFASEADIVEKIRCATGTGDARHPICFLVEAADDIAYLAADVEDAVKKKLLSWQEVECRLRDGNSESVQAAFASYCKILNTDQPETILDDDMRASAFRTAAIYEMVKAASEVFRERYDEIMEGIFPGTLLWNSAASELAKRLQKIAIEKIYPARSTLALELMGRHVVGDLMDVFWEGAETIPLDCAPDTSGFAGKSAALFSSNYVQVFQHSVNTKRTLPVEYHRFQLMTDYVCGMTDSFAKRLHADLFNGA